MELIKSFTRRSFLSEAIYVVLNVALAVALMLLVQQFDPPYLAIALLLLSKWRVFAVRPRFWFAHVQSNLVDVMVGLSYVALLYLSNGFIVAQILLMALFIAWLLVLKPRTKRRDVIWQGGVGQFVAIMALSSFSYSLPVSIFVAGVWLIVYGSTRHILAAYHEDDVTLLSLAYAFIIAELGWFYYHWMVAYPLSQTGSLAVPQLAITVFLLSFTAMRVYELVRGDRGDRVRFRDVRQPLLFMIIVLAVVFIRFTPWSIVL